MFRMSQTRKRYDRQFKIAAAQVVLSGDMTVRELSEELRAKDSTLRRWAQEYETMGDDAFPGNGSPKVNKDYEIAELRKQVEELGTGNGLLKNFRAFSGQDRARGASSSGSTGASSAPSGRLARSSWYPNPDTTNISVVESQTRRQGARPSSSS